MTLKFSFQNFNWDVGEKQPTYTFLILSWLAFYPHDKFFSGFGLTSGLLGSPPSVRLLPGVLQSPPGQSPLVESHVGAEIAIGCRERTSMQQEHQLEHSLKIHEPHSFSSCPDGNLVENEILRLRFQGPMRANSKKKGPQDNNVPRLTALPLIPHSPSSHRFLLFRLLFRYFLLLPPLLTPLWGVLFLPLFMPWLFNLRLVDIVLSAKMRGFAGLRGQSLGI